MKPDKTSTLLVDHLLAAPEKPQRPWIIDRALRLEYDDFGSPHVCPKIKLHGELLDAGYEDLARNVIEGIYD